MKYLCWIQYKQTNIHGFLVLREKWIFCVIIYNYRNHPQNHKITHASLATRTPVSHCYCSKNWQVTVSCIWKVVRLLKKQHCDWLQNVENTNNEMPLVSGDAHDIMKHDKWKNFIGQFGIYSCALVIECVCIKVCDWLA